MSGRNDRKRSAKDGRVKRHAKKRLFKDEKCLNGDGASEGGSDDGNSNEGFEEDWEKREIPRSMLDDVMRVYREVMIHYNNMIETEGKALFVSFAKEPTKKYEVDGELVPFKIGEPEAQPTSFVVRSVQNGAVQKVPCRVLEGILATPRMQFWTFTECNIACDDERSLSHIPFMGDRDEDDAGFGEELLETFAEGIHGTKVGCGELINDHILFHMLKKLFAKYRTSEETLMVYRAVYEQFPNKASVRQLQNLYHDLKMSFEPQPEQLEDQLTAHVGDGRALNSYQLLSCCRCFNYDCLLHSTTELEPRRRRGFVTTEPCGPTCFRHISKEMQEALRNGTQSETKTTDGHLNIKVDEGSWTVQQQATFAVLRRTFRNDYCKMASSLNLAVKDGTPKTCRELYIYSFHTGPISPRADISPTSPKKKRTKRDQHRKFRAVKWAQTEGKVGNTHVYEPCSHVGECSVANNCTCIILDNLCTKFCRCGEQCKYRFPGCRCAPGMCRTKQCQCFFANWECDPDTCKSCRCDNLDDVDETQICKNVAMQRGLQKNISISMSQVAGWGCFAMEDIEKNDFISEYCGEVISHDESERRGKIYDKLKCSYLFGLNDEMVVDATRKGNVIRFANHSKNPNCRAKVFMVNGDHRIGIFAASNIAAGEELFFDYSYNSHQQVKFVSKERPKPF